MILLLLHLLLQHALLHPQQHQRVLLRQLQDVWAFVQVRVQSILIVTFLLMGTEGARLRRAIALRRIVASTHFARVLMRRHFDSLATSVFGQDAVLDFAHRFVVLFGRVVDLLTDPAERVLICLTGGKGDDMIVLDHWKQCLLKA